MQCERVRVGACGGTYGCVAHAEDWRLTIAMRARPHTDLPCRCDMLLRSPEVKRRATARGCNLHARAMHTACLSPPTCKATCSAEHPEYNYNGPVISIPCPVRIADATHKQVVPLQCTSEVQVAFSDEGKCCDMCAQRTQRPRRGSGAK